jgi:hypothetical protein
MQIIKYILTFISDFIRTVGDGSPIGAAFIETAYKIFEATEGGTPGQAGGTPEPNSEPGGSTSPSNQVKELEKKENDDDSSDDGFDAGTTVKASKMNRKPVQGLFPSQESTPTRGSDSPFANLGSKLRIKNRNPK